MQLDTDTQRSSGQREYYVTVRFRIKADSPEVARDQIKWWLLRLHKAVNKYKTLYMPPGVNKVFEMETTPQEVDSDG